LIAVRRRRISRIDVIWKEKSLHFSCKRTQFLRVLGTLGEPARRAADQLGGIDANVCGFFIELAGRSG
jgi:hypothetical protein